LAKKLVHESGLPMVHVRDNRNISEFRVCHKNPKIAGFWG
jgi:hypothetical protein